MTLGGGNRVLGHAHLSHTVKMQNFHENSCSLLSDMDQKNWVYSDNDQERSTQIANFIINGPRVLVLEYGYISHIVKMHYFYKIFSSTPGHRSDKLSLK